MCLNTSASRFLSGSYHQTFLRVMLSVRQKEDGGAFKAEQVEMRHVQLKRAPGQGSLHLTSEPFSVTSVRAK